MSYIIRLQLDFLCSSWQNIFFSSIKLIRDLKRSKVNTWQTTLVNPNIIISHATLKMKFNILMRKMIYFILQLFSISLFHVAKISNCKLDVLNSKIFEMAILNYAVISFNQISQISISIFYCLQDIKLLSARLNSTPMSTIANTYFKSQMIHL